MNTTELNRVFGLDFLRALAICLVVFSHTTLLVFPNSVNTLVLGIRILGAVGVDLFFILSGFLIGGIILKKIDQHKTNTNDLIRFWKRRWLRTLPNYFLVLFLNILIFLFLGKNLPDTIALYVPFLQNFSYPHPNFFTESWSLSIEEFAYLLLPLFLYLSFILFKDCNKKNLFLWVTIAAVFGLLIIKVPYYLSTQIYSYNDWTSSFRKVVIYRIDSIYIGFLLIYGIRKYPEIVKKLKNYFLVLGIALFIFIHVIIYVFNLLPETNLGFYVFIYLQVVSLSLALLFPFFSELNYSGLFLKPIKFISLHSYSIYLVNYSLILLVIEEFFDTSSMFIFQKLALVLLFLGCTIILSTLIYKYFESPILTLRDRLIKRD